MDERELSARGQGARAVGRRTGLGLAVALLFTAQQVAAQAGAPDSHVIAATELRPAVSARPSQPAKGEPKEARNEREAQLRTAGNKLSSPDAELVQQGLNELGALGGKDAAQLVIARLKRGLPPQLIDTSIDALTRLHDASAIPVLLELATHRRFQVRAHAIEALGTLGAKNAEAVLLYALDDPSQDVRESAVRSLGKVGSRRALKPLLAAHERGLDGALGALGAIGSSAEADLLIARAKAGQVDAALPGFQAMLVRSNVPFATKTKLIATLRELGSARANDCMTQTLSALGDKGDPRLKAALGQALAGAATPVAARSSEVAK